ncbi:MAG: hypothetical protein ABI305_05780, partial [Tepidiformaceae bacterium]
PPRPSRLRGSIPAMYVNGSPPVDRQLVDPLDVRSISRDTLLFEPAVQQRFHRFAVAPPRKQHFPLFSDIGIRVRNCRAASTDLSLHAHQVIRGTEQVRGLNRSTCRSPGIEHPHTGCVRLIQRLLPNEPQPLRFRELKLLETFEALTMPHQSP